MNKNIGTNIGVVGLGAMGRGMAASLRRAGWNVHVCDVRLEAAQAFAADGGVACASPAELAAHCEVIVSVVVNAAQTDTVLFGDGGAAAAMQPGSLFIMCSTVDPNVSVQFEQRLAALGLVCVPRLDAASPAAVAEHLDPGRLLPRH